MRQDVDIGLAKFLSQEMTENAKRAELSNLLEEVDNLEAEVSNVRTRCDQWPFLALHCRFGTIDGELLKYR